MRLLFKLLVIVAFVAPFLAPERGTAEVVLREATKTLPDRIGKFQAQGPASLPPPKSDEVFPEDVSKAARIYASSSGTPFLVEVANTRMDSAAYSLLTRARPEGAQIKLGEIGTASIVTPSWLAFFKGTTFVKISQAETKSFDQGEMNVLAQGLAEQLSGGENDIPVLVKHLPDWQKVYPQALYVVSLQSLRTLLPNQLVLDSVSFAGGAEAVLGTYDSGKLLIVEFNTARIAGDNDWNIRTKIGQLRSQQSASVSPSAYRRVGNYGVFVFDAPSEQAANQLIDQVKYQQVVQWLGENPYLYENAQREFIQTTLGVFVAVVKGSGLALVTCFAVGGLLGALLFFRRRAQQRASEAYSDAGGMVRLNLDEVAPPVDPGRLIGDGN